MIEIIPAIIPHSFTEIEGRANMVRGLVKTIQVDVMDGFFVPEKSWPYEKGDMHALLEATRGEIGLPFWKEIDYEIDLMVSEPHRAIEEWTQAGAARVVVHIESVKDVEAIVSKYGNSETYELGLALNIETPNDSIAALISRCDFIQCMGIEKIGYQGEPFSEKVIPKIEDLRKRYPDAIISIDGGVNFENAPRLVEAGANRLVSGSTIWNASNIKEAIQKLKGDA